MMIVDESIERESMVKSFEESLLRLGKKYQNLVVLCSDSCKEVGTEDFSKFFRDRYFNIGLAEANMASCAVGFTIRGKVPFIVGNSTFLTGKAWEQIRNGICFPNLNVKIIGVKNGLLAGQEGVGYQALEDVAIMRSIPNMKIICPADYREALGAIDEAAFDYGPTYIRIPDEKLPVIYGKDYKFKMGKADTVREGSDICIFAMGQMVYTALQVAELLKKEGVSAMVVNVSTIKPIDEEKIIECSRKVNLSVSLEDHSVIGGLGSAISEVLSEKSPAVLRKIGVEDKFGESAKAVDLYRKHGLDVLSVFNKVKSYLR